MHRFICILILCWISVAPAISGAAPGDAPRKPLLPAAVDLAAIRPAPPESSYAHPLLGVEQSCSGISRQFVLMNSEIVVGEPVLFRLLLRLENPEIPSEFYARLLFGTDIIAEVYPQKIPGLTPYEYLGLELGSVTPNSTLKMEGYKIFRYTFHMGVDKNTVSGAAFDYPGTYLIRILMECRYEGVAIEKLDMGTFQLTVKPAEGDDAMALEILSEDHRIFEYIHLRRSRFPNGSRPLSERQFKLLQQVAEQCPKAALRPHALLLMADYWVDNAMPDRAIDIYQQIQKEYPDTPFYEEGLFMEMRTNVVLKREDRMKALFNRIWTDPYTTMVVYPMSPYWNTFVAPRLPIEPRTQWMLYDTPGKDPEAGAETMGGGLRILLSEEVQQMYGLPEEVTQEELNRRMNEILGGKVPEGPAPTPPPFLLEN